jgi:hypothetical protein
MKHNSAKIVRYICRMEFLVLSMALVACGDNIRGMDTISSCSESSERQVASPRGDYVATLYQRNCGATTGFVTHINLRFASEANLTQANGTISQGQILVAKGTPLIKLRWIDDTSLVLQVDPKDRPNIVSIQESWKSIRIKLDN